MWSIPDFSSLLRFIAAIANDAASSIVIFYLAFAGARKKGTLINVGE